MSIASEISRLQGAKAGIKDAIEAQGVTVLSSAKLDDYPAYISQISGGGGQVVIPNGMKFAYSTFTVLPQAFEEADWSNVVKMNVCFSSCSNLQSISLSGLDKVDNMGSCFTNCSLLTSVTLPALSNVTTLAYCFNNCSLLTSISLSGLSYVSTMSSCFYGCTSLTSVTLSGLSNISTLAHCFNGCSLLTSIALSGLSNVTTMVSCFNGCKAISTITLSGLSTVSGITNCFSGCTSLENLVVDSWGTAITNLTNWGISWCTLLTHESLINLISALPTTNTTRNCTIGTTNLAKLTAEEIAVATTKKWNLQ